MKSHVSSPTTIMSDQSRSRLPPAVTCDVLVYQNKQLSRVVRELRRSSKLVDARTTASEPASVTSPSSMDSMKLLIEELKGEKAALYARLDRVASRISFQAEPVESSNHAKSLEQDALASPPDVGVGDDNSRNEYLVSLHQEIVVLKSMLALSSVSDEQSQDSGQAAREMELFNLNSDRNIWIQKCRRSELDHLAFREAVQVKLDEVRQTVQMTEKTFLTEIERMSEELVQHQHEIRKYNLQVSDLEAKLKCANDRFADPIYEATHMGLTTDPPDVSNLKDQLRQTNASLARYRDQLRIKEEQCSRILAQHVQLQHHLTGIEQENAILRSQSATASELIATTSENMKAVDDQRAGEAHFVASLESEGRKELNWRIRLIEESSSLKNRIAEIEDVHSRANNAWSKLQSEYQDCVQQLTEAKREKPVPMARQTSNISSLAQMELEDIRTKVKCSLCLTRTKSVALTTCMHCFCRECVDAQMLNARNRKCPLCMQRFSDAEVREVHFLKD